MNKSRFIDEQIVKILRESDKDPGADVAKRHAITELTIYFWRARFGEMAGNDVNRLKDPEVENDRLTALADHAHCSSQSVGLQVRVARGVRLCDGCKKRLLG